MAISYIAKGEQRKVENGDFAIVGRAIDGSIIVDDEDYEAKIIPGTNWQIYLHSASEYGTKILTNIIVSKYINYYIFASNRLEIFFHFVY